MTLPEHPSVDELLAFDRQHLWHPYSSFVDPPPVFPVASAQGTRIRLLDGREVIDAMASWWSAIHGYDHPQLNAAIAAQSAQMSHVMFGGFTHTPAIELADRLLTLTPAGMDAVFFADSGSVAVEVAIKMAVQYWAAKAKPGKHRLMTIRGGYHGDTIGAMAVCDPVTGMHGLFRGILPEHIFAPRPSIAFSAEWQADANAAFRALLSQHHDEIAAVILEPVVQGAGGMWFYHPNYLREIRAACDEFEILLICDEIATGFGRTGRWFASEHAQIAPDLMCLGKALTGGYLSFAATVVQGHVAATISSGEPSAFMHGPTFMANPLACAVAGASIDLLADSAWQQTIKRIETCLASKLERCRELPSVCDVRVLGAIGVVELHAPIDMHRAPQMFVERGVWVRPFGRLVYVMPPYIISNHEISVVAEAIYEVVRALS